MAFVHYRKHFNSVNILTFLKAPILQSLQYAKTDFSSLGFLKRIYGGNNETPTTSKGVRQEDTISPKFFTLASEERVWNFRLQQERNENLWLIPESFTASDYVIVMCENIEKLKTMIEELTDASAAISF